MADEFYRIDDHSAFVFEPLQTDAVVFVHGMGGDYAATWKKFPSLLATDQDLPVLDILMWGYPTSWIRKRRLCNIKTLGRHFVSAVSSNLSNSGRVHIVGHSMGGLIALQGLISELRDDRSGEHPARSVSFLSLFASPVSGSTAGAVVQNTLGFGWVLMNKQTRDLARGVGVDEMLTEVYNRIYPADSEGSSKRHIPIRMIMATKDAVVTETDRDSTKARFRLKPPLEYDFGHSSIKEPNDHDDPRYRALVNDLQSSIVRTRFVELADQYFNGAMLEQQAAAGELDARYTPIFLHYYFAAGGDKDKSDRFRKFVEAVMKDCLGSQRTPAQSARLVVLAFLNRGHLGS